MFAKSVSSIARNFCKKVIVPRPEFTPAIDYKLAPIKDISNNPGPLTKSQLKQYMEDGFLLVKDVFKKEDIYAARKGIQDLTDIVAETLMKNGLIKDPHYGMDWTKRLIKLEEQFKGASVIYHKIDNMHHSFATLYEARDMLEILKQLGLGPDIAAHPNWNVRSKIPGSGEFNVPWHQDNSYMPPDIWHEEVMSAWFPLLPVDENNGCMQYVKKAHLSGRTARHTLCEGNTWYTELTDEEISNN